MKNPILDLNKKVNNQNKIRGFTLVELIVAVSIIAFFVVSVFSIISSNIKISQKSIYLSQANFLLEEGAEAVKIIRDKSWSNISNLSTSVVYYLKMSMSWTLATIPEMNQWYSVTYGNGIFVVLSWNGTGAHQVATSSDGLNWALQTAPSKAWNSMAYGNGMFVAVSGNGTNRVMTSPDGIIWTERASALETNMWKSVAYGNGTFVAVGSGASSVPSNKVMTSPDGITWTLRTLPGSAPTLGKVTYGNGKFVAVGTGSPNNVYVSSNGITWQGLVLAPSPKYITYGNGIFVIVHADLSNNVSSVSVSSNGTNWTSKSFYASAQDVYFGEGFFVMYSGGSIVYTSSDGLNWETESCPTSGIWTSMAYGNGTFVAVSYIASGNNKVMTSSGGAWTLVTTPNTIDNFTRTVTVSSVKRDSITSDISSSGVDDSGTKLITTNVSWNESGSIISKSLKFYISNIFQ